MRILGYSFFSKAISSSFIKEHQGTGSLIKIIKECTLTSFALHRYLYQRQVPIEVAKQSWKEVTYEVFSKRYFTIQWKYKLLDL